MVDLDIDGHFGSEITMSQVMVWKWQEVRANLTMSWMTMKTHLLYIWIQTIHMILTTDDDEETVMKTVTTMVV